MKAEEQTGAVIEKFMGMGYLADGNRRQQSAYAVLTGLGLMEQLSSYTPVLTGTIPIQIDIPGSDLDVICEVHDFVRFQLDVSRVLGEAGITTRFRTREVAGIPRVVCNFTFQGQEVELFGQPLPVTEQNSWRHMIVEARLLTLLGDRGREEIRRLKLDGLKTEPAFGQLLNLNGDPYEALLAMYDWDDRRIHDLVRGRGLGQVKAVVLDLDGTLLTTSKRISERNRNALHQINQSGIPIIFATARPPRAARHDDLDLPLIGSMVYYNGALFHCKITDKIFHYAIPALLAGSVIDSCLELAPEAQFSIEVMDRWYCYRPLDFSGITHFAEQPSLISLEELRSAECTKILLADFTKAEQLVRQYGTRLNIVVTDGGSLVQIMAAEASKELAVRKLCDELGVSLDDVMCFGDDYNDLGLFRACGYPVAMGNAVPGLKDLAWEVTETNDNDGVAVMLERITNNESMEG